MKDVFKILSVGKSNDPLWEFTYPELVRDIKKCGLMLGQEIVPYPLRHAGASWDIYKTNLNLFDVQRRGGWMSAKNVQSYE
eukprot:8259247-Pyramimonas_sp.AAC.1